MADVTGHIQEVEIQDSSFAVADGNALGEGVLVQGDDGTDRKNINVDATTGDVQVDVTNTVTVTATDLDVQSGGADLATSAQGSAIQTAVQLIDNAAFADSAAFTEGSSGVLVAGAIRDDVIVDAQDTAADAQSLHTNDQGALWVAPAHIDSTDDILRDEDLDETAAEVTDSPAVVYGFIATNLDATPVYIHFYNVVDTSVTVGTTGEELTICVPSQGDANGAAGVFTFPVPVYFDTAVSMAATTTIGGTAGPGTNEVVINVFFRNI